MVNAFKREQKGDLRRFVRITESNLQLHRIVERRAGVANVQLAEGGHVIAITLFRDDDEGDAQTERQETSATEDTQTPPHSSTDPARSRASPAKV